MEEYIVPDLYSYEEAMWLSQAGDTIRITSGDYGIIPIKGGVTIKFDNDASFTSIFAGVGGKGNITVINGKQQNNIKAWFYFIRSLPFDLRLEVPTKENPPLQFCTPEGCILEFFGNMGIIPEKGIGMGPPQYLGDSYQARRPKALVQIAVPSDLDIDFSVLNQSEEAKLETKATFAKIEENNKIHFAIDGRSYGSRKQQPYFLPCGDMMYLGLWTLNRFLRRYGEMTGADKLTREGLSFSQFKDGLGVTVVNAQDIQQTYSFQSSYVESFQSIPITEEDMRKIQETMVSAPDYTLQEHIEFFLDRLHYHLATISIQQALEISLDNFLNGKNGYKLDTDGYLIDNKGKKVINIWIKLDATPIKSYIPFTTDQIKYLCELIEARNNIMHSGHCKVDANTKTRRRCATIKSLSEYRIYKEKRPWYWYYEGVLPLLKKMI